jgi:hypothetical protein
MYIYVYEYSVCVCIYMDVYIYIPYILYMYFKPTRDAGQVFDIPAGTVPSDSKP